MGIVASGFAGIANFEKCWQLFVCYFNERSVSSFQSRDFNQVAWQRSGSQQVQSTRSKLFLLKATFSPVAFCIIQAKKFNDM